MALVDLFADPPTSKSINLLNALTVQLGSATAPGYSWSYHRPHGDHQASHDLSTAVFAEYCDAASATNEVVARPTLATIEELPSEFFADQSNVGPRVEFRIQPWQRAHSGKSIATFTLHNLASRKLRILSSRIRG